MPDEYHYFGCTVSFDCPICGRASAEKLVYRARNNVPDRLARVLARQSFDCQLCGAALTSRRTFKIHVLPADLERLRKLGFAVRRAA